MAKPTQANLSALLRFRRPATHDTTIVQLALNANDAHQVAHKAWRELRDQLKAILDDVVLEKTWGYSLIYQATTNDELETLAWDTLLPIDKSQELAQDSKLLHLSSSQALQPLAEMRLAEGRLWLATIPFKHNGTVYEGLQAATVYVAVSSKDQNDQFVTEVLYGSSASLLMPDMIAHKGYHQIRQYRAIVQSYSDKVNEMLRLNLEKLPLSTSAQQTKALENLNQECLIIREGIAKLDALYISLITHLYNYKLQQTWPTDDKVILFHYAHLDVASQEIKLRIEEGQSVLQAIDTAVKIIQSKLETQRQKQRSWIETQRSRIETVLAIMTVALGVPQFMSQDVVKTLIQDYLPNDFKRLIQHYLADYLGISMTSCSQDSVCLAGVQFTITALIGLVVYWRFHSK